MTDWDTTFSRRHLQMDSLGWVAAASAVLVTLVAGTTLALRLQTAEGLEIAQEDIILLDMQPPTPAVLVLRMPAPDAPMTDMPEGQHQPEIATDATPQLPSAQDAQPIRPKSPKPMLSPDTVSADVALPARPPKVKPASPSVAKAAPEAAETPVKDAPAQTPKPKEKPASPAKSATAPPPSLQSVAPKAAAPTAEAGTAKAAVPRGQLKSLLARWGASIRAKVERRNAYPKSANGATGTVTLQLVVASNGALSSVQLAASSGVAVLDAAALQAVKRAGKFNAAPQDLPAKNYGFTLQLTFAK